MTRLLTAAALGAFVAWVWCLARMAGGDDLLTFEDALREAEAILAGTESEAA